MNKDGLSERLRELDENNPVVHAVLTHQRIEALPDLDTAVLLIKVLVAENDDLMRRWTGKPLSPMFVDGRCTCRRRGYSGIGHMPGCPAKGAGR